jgi:hypothetical protein
MVVDLLESIAVLGGIILLCLLLPATFLKDDFLVRGTWLAISFIGILMVYLIPALDVKRWVASPGLWFLITVLLSTLLTILFSRLRIMKRFAFFFSDRTTVFLFFFTPLSVIALLIIVIRFLF